MVDLHLLHSDAEQVGLLLNFVLHLLDDSVTFVEVHGGIRDFVSLQKGLTELVSE